jgi:hypothetical protein
VQGNVVAAGLAAVGAGADLCAESNLRGQPDHGDAYSIANQVGDGVVYLAGVAGESRPVYYEDFSRSVCWGMAWLGLAT